MATKVLFHIISGLLPTDHAVAGW